MTKRLKILISAFGCSPTGSAEDLVAWNWILTLAENHDIWALTNYDRKSEIESALAQNPMTHVHWIYQNIPDGLRRITNIETGARVHYTYWQWVAYITAKKLHREVNLDYVHHITFVQYWTPSYMVNLPIPFIWGPVGGGEIAPRSFYKTFGLRGVLYEAIRDVIRLIGEVRPGVRRDARNAILTMATTPETARRLRRLGAKNVKILPTIQLGQSEYERYDTVPIIDDQPLRILSAGRLLHWKGFHLGIIAFADHLKSHPNTEYWIAGDGPDRRRLEKLVTQYKVQDHVRFLGAVPHHDIVNLFTQCAIVLHPSLHDSGGKIILEAMAARRVVICLNLGGPGQIVSDGSGIKVEAANPQQTISDLSIAITKVAQDVALRHVLAEQANQHVKENFIYTNTRRHAQAIYELADELRGS